MLQAKQGLGAFPGVSFAEMQKEQSNKNRANRGDLGVQAVTDQSRELFGAGRPVRQVALMAAALSLLASCVGGPTLPGTAAQVATAMPEAAEVEAPQVFATTDLALWDGRPSLGGVWVASPDATDPERVKITNPATGATITGALFRREAFNPGPRLQLSSDAAEALGLLAGAPTEVSVVALRRAETAAEIGADALAAVATLPAAPATDSAPLDPAAEPDTAPTSQVEPAAVAAPAPDATAASGEGMVQVAIFSVEANAEKTLETLAAAGIPAVIDPVTRNGKPLWVVTTVASDDAAGLLAKVKALGFADAYVLQR